MDWKNPDGSLTRGVVIEDGAGNKVTSFGGGGGGGGGSVSVSNFPATQAVSWSGQNVSLSGFLPAFATTPAFTLGAALPAGANLIGAVNLDIGGAPVSPNNPVPTTESYSSIATGQVSVTASATQVVAARAGRKEVTIVNHATTAVYIGGSGVTAATGLLLAGVQGQGITVTGGAAIYAIAASGSETVSFLEVY